MRSGVANSLRLYSQRLKEIGQDAWMLLAGNFLLGVGASFLFLFLNLHFRSLGLSNDGVAEMQFLLQFAGALGAIPALVLITRIDLKKALLLSVVVSSLCLSVAFALPHSEITVAIFSVGAAASAATRIIAAPLLMEHTSGRERPYAFSMLFLAMFGSALIGNMSGGFLASFMERAAPSAIAGFALPEKYGLVLILGQILGLSALFPFSMIRSESSNEDEKRVDLSKLASWKQIRLVFLAKALLPHFMIACGAGLIMQFINLYLVDTFQVTDTTLATVMTLQSATMILGVLAAPFLAEKQGKVNTVLASQLLSLPFMIVLALSSNWTICLIALVSRAALMNMSSPIADSLLLEMCSRTEQAVFNALKTVFWALAWASGSLIYGFLLGGDHSLAFLVSASLYFGSTCLFALFFHDETASGRQLSSAFRSFALMRARRSEPQS